jgi:hypothetical protein
MPKSYDPEYYAKNREKLKARSLAYYHRKAEERRHAFVPPSQRVPWATDSSANGLVKRTDVSGGMHVHFSEDEEPKACEPKEIHIPGLIISDDT